MRNLLKNNLFLFSQVRKQMKWRSNPNGVQIYYQDPKSLQKIVFYATPNIKISQFLLASQINQQQVSFPQGVNSQTDIVQYLLQRQNAKAMQIKYKGDLLVLRNRAWQFFYDTVSKDLIQVIRDQKGIYQHLQEFLKNNQPKFFIQRSNYLTRYYLKLQAECYIRAKKITPTGLLTPKIKQDILNYLNLKNQVNSQQLIQQVLQQQVKIRMAMQQTQSKILQLNNFYQGRENIYKRSAILITLVHLVSFGYMIFGVDWLGWDIIEPLTYTVGVVYTLLGIRFYRKYKVNRSSDNIRQALFNMIMPPEKRILLKSNEARLAVQKQQLKKILQEHQILKNKLAYKTTLIQNLQTSSV